MRRVNPWMTRLAGLLAALPACSSTPSASSQGTPDRHQAPPAREWTGSHVTAPVPDVPALPGGTWVLHIGDSFVEASLQQNLGPRFRSARAGYVVDATTSTYTTTWASDSGLDDWLSRRPSLVLVTLGANEVDIPAPGLHARAVEAIAQKIARAGASCVWITPPLWKGETGILEVIHDHCAPCLFFDSDAVLSGLSVDERQRDRVHPNSRGGERWARAVWQWLVDHRGAGGGAWALEAFERRGS